MLSILEFSAGSTGNVTPIRTISGSATTLLAGGNLTVDGAGNIYILNALSILVFGATANGNVAPTAVIDGSAGGVFNGRSIVVK
jgi:hypothetical protein